MNRDEVLAATSEAVRAAEELAAHLERLSTRMAALLPAEPDALSRWEDDPWERLHALLRTTLDAIPVSAAVPLAPGKE